MRVPLLLLAAMLVVPLGIPPTAAADDLLVYVRVETPAGNVFRDWVRVPETVSFVAYNNGQSYTIEGNTPLGALLAAAQGGGFEVLVTDEYLGIDFSVDAIEDYWQQGTWWWDYRVNWVSTYYGIHRGWQQAGPGLHDGDEVLWYRETIGTMPMRARATPLAAAPGTCVYALAVDIAFPDFVHRPGQPWPTPNWTPVPEASIAGDVEGVAVAGRAVVAVPGGGATVWAEDTSWAVADLDFVRSDRLALACAA